jgi:hypothetical protein
VLQCSVSTFHMMWQSTSVSDDKLHYVFSMDNTKHLHIQSISLNSIIIPYNFIFYSLKIL